MLLEVQEFSRVLKRGAGRGLAVLGLLLGLAGTLHADDPAPFGSTVPVASTPVEAAPPAAGPKLRLLIDKVLARAQKEVTDERVVKAVADAGFTHFSPRQGAEKLDQVRAVAELCTRHQLGYLPFLRLTRAPPAVRGAAPETRERYLLADGRQPAIYSPNSAALWDWLTPLILSYAELSRTQPALRGVFLDAEIYAEPWVGWAYGLSYDDETLAAFAKTRELTLPDLAPVKRAAWLKEQNLHEAFAEFQVAGWRARCRALRQAVDALNPKFEFWVYPGPKSKFLADAALPEWTSAAAPLVWANIDTYGRPPWYGGAPVIAQAAGLAANSRLLLAERRYLTGRGLPFRQVGGLDPAISGADPEYCARHAAMVSGQSEGYWVFYEGPTFGRPDHREYWHWLSLANAAITGADAEFAQAPRVTPDWHDAPPALIAEGQIGIGLMGVPAGALAGPEVPKHWQVVPLAAPTAAQLAPLRAVVLRDFSYAPWHLKQARQDLPAWVANGGTLILLHEAGVMLQPAFKDIATPGAPVAAGQLADLFLRLGETVTTLSAKDLPAWTLLPGKHGQPILTPAPDQALAAVGRHGQGQVLIWGLAPSPAGQPDPTLTQLPRLLQHLLPAP